MVWVVLLFFPTKWQLKLQIVWLIDIWLWSVKTRRMISGCINLMLAKNIVLPFLLISFFESPCTFVILHGWKKIIILTYMSRIEMDNVIRMCVLGKYSPLDHVGSLRQVESAFNGINKCKGVVGTRLLLRQNNSTLSL